jgi:hypothetical protein
MILLTTLGDENFATKTPVNRLSLVTLLLKPSPLIPESILHSMSEGCSKFASASHAVSHSQAFC